MGIVTGMGCQSSPMEDYPGRLTSANSHHSQGTLPTLVEQQAHALCAMRQDLLHLVQENRSAMAVVDKTAKAIEDLQRTLDKGIEEFINTLRAPL